LWSGAGSLPPPRSDLVCDLGSAVGTSLTLSPLHTFGLITLQRGDLSFVHVDTLYTSALGCAGGQVREHSFADESDTPRCGNNKCLT
jgi:hypothetical protein